MICQHASHVGPAAQIVLYTYGSISCSIHNVDLFMEDVNQKLQDIRYSYFSFQKLINDYYDQFVQNNGSILSTTLISVIQNYRKNIMSNITSLDDYVIYLSKKLDNVTKDFPSVVEDLSSQSYKKSMKAINQSIVDKKSCVANITSEFKVLFNILHCRIYKMS